MDGDDDQAGLGRRHVVAAGLGAAMLGGPAARAAGAALATPALPRAWTDAPRIPLWPAGPPGTGFAPRPLDVADAPASFLHDVASPYLRVFRPTGAGNGRALLVIPGGGYMFVSVDNEGVQVAKAATARGYTVFVLVYRLPDEGWADRADVPLQDAQRALRIVRGSAAAYGVDPARIGVLGFSAGGHLAATLATDFAQRVAAPRDAIDRLDARPAVAALIYPVISMTPPVTHMGSRISLLGPDPTPDAVRRRSPAAQVGATTPPTVLVHALDDRAVPPDNSLEMLAALRAQQRPAAAHLFEQGGHGFGLGVAGTPVARWFDLVLAFAGHHLEVTG